MTYFLLNHAQFEEYFFWCPTPLPCKKKLIYSRNLLPPPTISYTESGCGNLLRNLGIFLPTYITRCHRKKPFWFSLHSQTQIWMSVVHVFLYCPSKLHSCTSVNFKSIYTPNTSLLANGRISNWSTHRTRNWIRSTLRFTFVSFSGTQIHKNPFQKS
jgi:hypothetical protein